MKWFTLNWWKYLFEKREHCSKDIPMISVIICRARGHPCGVVWYNLNGLEPDMHCKNCGDDLG